MQNKKASIQRNYIYNLLYDILVLIVPFITTPYISRALSIDSIGLYSYSYSIVMYFTAFVALGTKSYAIKRIAQSRDQSEASYVFWNTFILRLISGCSALAVYCLYAKLAADNTHVALIQSIYIIAVIFDISWFFQGLESFKTIVLRNAVFKVISVALIFLLVRSDGDFVKYLYILSGVSMVGNLSLWSLLPLNLTKVRIRGIRPFSGIKEIAVLFIPTLALQIYSAVGNTMLGAICGDMSQNGYYEQANKIVSILLTLITSLGIVVLPRISSLYAEREYDKIRSHMQSSYRFVMLMSLPMMFGLCSIGDRLIPWFLGDGYAKSVPIVYILSTLFIIMGISNITGFQYLVATDRQGVYSLSIVVGVAVNFAANAFLIPRLSAIGVAISTVVSECAVCAIQLAYTVAIKREYSLRSVFGGVWRYLVGSVIMSFVIQLLKLIDFNVFCGLMLDIAVGGVIYFGFLMLTKDQIVLTYIGSFVKKIKMNSGD